MQSHPDILLDPKTNDPQAREDRLPYPYSTIDQILSQTILHRLNLQMHQIQQKKKDNNYEGGVIDFVGQNFIDIEAISCFSRPHKMHNHLLAGDKFGNVYLLDLAKRSVFSKKEVVSAKKAICIYDATVTDGDTTITTAAVINHCHHVVTILRYRYSEPKLYVTDEVHVAADSSDPNNLPYTCELHDFCRLLSVKTYSGKILFYKLPELTLEIEKKTKASSIPLEEEQIKKLLKYPLEMVTLEGETRKISEKALEISFKGQRIVPKYSDVKAKLMNLKKTAAPPAEEIKKDPKKKDDKKAQAAEPEKVEPTLQHNKKLELAKLQQVNGADCSASYTTPQFQPFVYVVEQSFSMPKSKYFEKSKNIGLPSWIIYGWKNTKQFYISKIDTPALENVPQFLQIAYFQEVLTPEKIQLLKDYHAKKLQIEIENVFRNVHPITSTAISVQDKSLIAFGLKDGTISIWNPISQNLQFNTEKHAQSVTALCFFQKWKLISGDASNQIFIHNVYTRTTQTKRTNIFQPKHTIPIVAIEVNDLGIAFCLDAHANMRVFDLWRNEKIAKINACSSYSMTQGKGKRWISANFVPNSCILYTNRDFTVIVSVNWPTLAPRQEDRTPEEIAKLQQITENPWKILGTNTHVIRNYDLLLSLFEGLESVYKRGYERRKIENLFTNLEFAQLRDRTFEIPDFSKPEATLNMKRNTSVNKSMFSAHRASQNTVGSSKSKQKSAKLEETSQIKLTNEVLHPEKFLFERRKIVRDTLITPDSLVELLREEHCKKESRENKLVTDTSKNVL